MEGTDMFYVKIWLTDGFFYNRIFFTNFGPIFFQTEKNLVIDCFRIKAKIFEVGRYLNSKKNHLAPTLFLHFMGLHCRIVGT
jgi:hypothetical protein